MRAFLLIVMGLSVAMALQAQSHTSIRRSFLKLKDLRFREQLQAESKAATKVDEQAIPVNPCSTSPCNVHATCAQTATSYTCKCDANYEGDGLTCFELNLCVKDPKNACHAKATCTPIGAGQVSCKCGKGYSGNGHECIEVNPCTSGPCDNTAICQMSGPGQYNCTCDPGVNMVGGRCVRPQKGDDMQFQLEASKQIQLLRNVQREAEMREEEIEHENKLGELERRVMDLGRSSAVDADETQDATIKTLEDEVLKVQDVTMELAKRATEQNEMLRELAAHHHVDIPIDGPLPDLPAAPTPAPPVPAPVPDNGKRLAIIVPRTEIIPLPLEPAVPQTAPITTEGVDVSKFTVAHIVG